VHFHGLSERHHAIDDGPKTTLFDVPEDAEQVALGAHRGSDELDLPEEHVPQIDLRSEARRRATRDDASAPGGREDALREDVAADVLDDQIDAALPRPRRASLLARPSPRCRSW
jgi:hypothetical protein